MIIQDFIPYNSSFLWDIHREYYGQRGLEAWKEGEVPYYSINSYPMAKQHALFVIQFINSQYQLGHIDDESPIYILEIGAGMCVFVENFFKALYHDCGYPGKVLASRLKYILSDFNTTSLEQALTRDQLQHLVQHQQVIPACFDMTSPEHLHDLNGTPIDVPISLLIANYVCCVSAVKIVQYENDTWSELYLQVASENAVDIDEVMKMAKEDYQTIKNLDITLEYRPVKLNKLFSKPIHEQIIHGVRGDISPATFAYPYSFLEMMQVLSKRLQPGGSFLINDYGNSPNDGIRASKKNIQIYGNSINHSVDFRIFTSMAKQLGWDILQTPDPIRAIHHACLRCDHQFEPTLRNGFSLYYTNCFHGEDLLVFDTLTRQNYKQQNFEKAAFFAVRCSLLEPDNPKYLYIAGQSFIALEKYRAAQYYLHKGMQLPRSEKYNFAFQMGRISILTNKEAEAIAWYKKAAEVDPFPTIYTNLGTIYSQHKQIKKAYEAFQQALQLDAENPKAKESIKELQEILWQQQLEKWKEET